MKILKEKNINNQIFNSRKVNYKNFKTNIFQKINKYKKYCLMFLIILQTIILSCWK